MRMQFYCSSQFKEGYVYGEIGEDKRIRRISRTCVDSFFMGSGIDCALLRTVEGLVLVIKGITTPKDGRGRTGRTDQTKSPLHINVAFVANSPKDECSLRSLLLMYLLDSKKMSEMLFNAYNEGAGGETGYSFDYQELVKLISYADSTYPVIENGETFAKEEYLFVDQQKAIDLLLNNVPPYSNGVFLVKTNLSQGNYIRRYTGNGESLPWYVLGEETIQNETDSRRITFTDIVFNVLKKIPWGVYLGLVGAIIAFFMIMYLNRTITPTNLVLRYKVLPGLEVECSWNADKAVRYDVTVNGVTESFGQDVLSKVYKADAMKDFQYQVVAYGKNDDKGISVQATPISMSDLALYEALRQEEEQKKNDNNQMLANILSGLNENNSLSVTINDEYDLSMDMKLTDHELSINHITLSPHENQGKEEPNMGENAGVNVEEDNGVKEESDNDSIGESGVNTEENDSADEKNHEEPSDKEDALSDGEDDTLDEVSEEDKKNNDEEPGQEQDNDQNASALENDATAVDTGVADLPTDDNEGAEEKLSQEKASAETEGDNIPKMTSAPNEDAGGENPSESNEEDKTECGLLVLRS